mgnify:CR=1 FL=1
MSKAGSPGASAFQTLKDKHRKLRENFPEHVSLRVHRALSWLNRAEAEADDPDVRFILLWIGFNAAYASELVNSGENERSVFKVFFDQLVSLDAERKIYELVWKRFPHEIRILLVT